MGEGVPEHGDSPGRGRQVLAKVGVVKAERVAAEVVERRSRLEVATERPLQVGDAVGLGGALPPRRGERAHPRKCRAEHAQGKLSGADAEEDEGDRLADPPPHGPLDSPRPGSKTTSNDITSPGADTFRSEKRPGVPSYAAVLGAVSGPGPIARPAHGSPASPRFPPRDVPMSRCDGQVSAVSRSIRLCATSSCERRYE